MDLITDLSRSNVAVLQIDGITLLVHSQCPYDEHGNPFFPLVHPATIQLLALLNYPRSSEQYIYLGIRHGNTHGLILQSTPSLPKVNWARLQEGLDQHLVDIKSTTFDQKILSSLHGHSAVLTELNAVDVKGIDVFDKEKAIWQGRLGMTNRCVHGLSRATYPNAIPRPSSWPLGSVGRLLAQPKDLHDLSQIQQLLEKNRGFK